MGYTDIIGRLAISLSNVRVKVASQCYSVLSPISPLFELLVHYNASGNTNSEMCLDWYSASRLLQCLSVSGSFLRAPFKSVISFQPTANLYASVACQLNAKPRGERWPQGREAAWIQWHWTSSGRLICQSGLEMEGSCCLVHYLFLAAGEM